MKTRLLGNSDIALAEIGLGCMGMSEFYGPSDDQQSLATLTRALDLGVNFFDTADTYGMGHNERLLGEFIKQGNTARRRKVVIATKFGIVRQAGQYERQIDNHPDYIRAACEASLQRLGVDEIDLYYCHRRQADVPIEEVVGAMADLVHAGKVRQLGLSEISPATLRRANAVHPIAAVQSEYSLWSRGPENGLLAVCAELGASFVAYSPLGRAFLTGTVKSDTLAEDDFRKFNPRFQGEAAIVNQALVDKLQAFSTARGFTNAHIALAWLLNKHPHVIPIPGTRQIHYVEQNMAAAAITLTAAELATLDELFLPAHVSGARYPAAGFAGVEQA